MYACVGLCAYDFGYLWRSEDVESPGDGITGSYDVFHMGAIFPAHPNVMFLPLSIYKRTLDFSILI